MAIININNLDPSIIKRELQAINGITPEIAVQIGEYLEKNGPFKSKEEFMVLVKSVNVNPEFFPLIDTAIGVFPPLFLFPCDPRDSFFDDITPENVEKKGTPTETGGEVEEKVKLTCTWKYRITCQTTLDNVLINFQGTRFLIDVKNKREKLVVAEGMVSYECEDEAPGNCKPEPQALDYDQPEITTSNIQFDATIINAHLGGMATISSPTLSATSEIRLTLTNGGRCYLALIKTKIMFTPGKAEVPVKGVPFSLSIGEPFEDTYTNKYLICCCRFNSSLDELGDVGDVEIVDAPLDKTEELSERDCGCGCRFTHISSRFKNSIAPIAWTVEAFEGGCKDQRAIRNIDDEGRIIVEVKNRTQPVKKVKRDDRGQVVTDGKGAK